MHMMPPAMTAAMTTAMMVAMMLPSLAPTLWRHHHHLRAAQASRAGQRTALFAAGYVIVWAVVGLALFAISAKLSPMRIAPWTGAVVLCAGALQRSKWKAKHLLRCRQACVTARAVPRTVLTAWRDGCRLGVECGLSCAAAMVFLLVAGLMDARMMAVITAAITAERVAPAGPRIARLTGALTLIAGLVMCVRALGVTMAGVV